MTSTTDDERRSRPLALHLARHRQWYPLRSITQQELRLTAGLGREKLLQLEGCRQLPADFDALFRLALALNVDVEQLVAPHLAYERKAEIEEHRVKLGLVLPREDESRCPRCGRQ